MKNEKNKKVLGTIISLIVGGLVGVLSIWTIGFDFVDKMGLGEFLLGYMGTFLMFCAVLYIDIIYDISNSSLIIYCCNYIIICCFLYKKSIEKP